MDIAVRILVVLLGGAAGFGLGWHFGFWNGWFAMMEEQTRQLRRRHPAKPTVPFGADDEDESDSMFGDDSG